MEKKKLRKLIILICFIAVFLISFYFLVGRPMLRFIGEPDKLSQYIQDKGVSGYAVFCAFVAVQSFSNCIPGMPFYLSSGYVLGGIKAALLCDLGSTIGNTFAFLIGRRFGKKLLCEIFSDKKIKSVEKYIDERNPKLIHFLFMLLALPKDTYAWFGYYSGENLIQWILITFIARFPHILIYTTAGRQLTTQKYGSFIFGAVFATLSYVIMFFVLKRKQGKK
ncbi:TVP38/TMEM64 family protein [Butyrivibrio sp. NC2002]|uniref:TVP38/TMEM64 family protein n=1 Tax=Butyrivibrio sp. NC2002 TaxID=1410610 RepID=UPI0005606EA8|nr:VTT domain-containing protein [Butyrivibrio sp. NC2002]